MAARPSLWLIGGTQESAQLARAIVQAHLPCVVTVTTEQARSLYPSVPGLRIWVGTLTAEQMASFLKLQRVSAILDASHPFAAAVSELAIAAATTHHLPYLRYERQSWNEQEPADSEVQHFETVDALLASHVLQGERVLLTMGYRRLQQFQPWQQAATLFARILPSATALEAALAAGFTPDRLIAIRPPIVAELETALWQQWHISTVVTKASGVAGGEAVKRQVAAALGVKLVIVDRPAIAYPHQTSNLQTALTFCKQVLALDARSQ
ncbi:cobalt-precorrin-6A reductase [Oculatella sp. LEGE 06141]|nr:cobalt-precorrin-6A reductase [Oculatella sp. LEGE 06141]